MKKKRLEDQIRFVVEIDKLKSIERRSPLVHADRKENSAEHSWHIAMLAVVLAEHSNEDVDLGHVMKLLLVHDIVEIDAGDTYIHDTEGHKDKREREIAAAERIFQILPSDQAEEVREIWEEYEAHETKESKFAHAMDRLMPLLHHFHTQGKVWKEKGVTKQQALKISEKIRPGSEKLWEHAKEIIEQADAAGYFSDESNS